MDVRKQPDRVTAGAGAHGRVLEAVRAGVGLRDFDAAYDYALGFEVDGVVIEPWQDRDEMRRLWEILERDPPRTIVEIGTKFGGSLFLLARAAAPDALIVAVDLPSSYDPARDALFRALAGPGQEIRPVWKDSRDPAAGHAIREALDGRPVDFLHIDGDHTLPGVQGDFETYGPLVRPGGLIALHDIEGREDVPEFWRSLRAARPHTTEEIVSPRSKIGFGLVRV